MTQLIYMATTLLVLGIVIGLAVRKQRRDDAAREAQFRATMLALEEKAKKEGTFVVSYFNE